MIVYFLLLAFLGAISFLLGKKASKLLGVESADGNIVYIWIGVGLIGIVGTGLGLVGPIGVYLFAAISAVVILNAKNEIREGLSSLSATSVAGIAALLSLSAFWCNQAVFWYDSGLYHIQSVKWLSTYGYVWGEGLLHTRLGVISSWFSIPAFLDDFALEGRVYTVGGGVATLLILSHLSVAAAKIFARRGELSHYFAFFAYLLALPKILSWGVGISPSPDLPIIALSIVVGSLVIRHIETKEDAYIKQALILGVIATTIKLSGAAIVIGVGAYMLLSKRGELLQKSNLVLITACAALLLPNIAASVKTTGSLWYPAPIVLDTAWGLSKETAQKEVETIRNWARWDGGQPEGKGGLEWILPKNKPDVLAAGKVTQYLLLLASGAVLVAVLAVSAYKRNRKYLFFAAFSAWLVAFWLYSAPTLRFGLGVLVWLPAFALGYWRYRASLRKKAVLVQWASFGAAALVVTILLKLVGHNVIEEGVYRGLIAKEQKIEWLLPTESMSLTVGARIMGNKAIPAAAPIQLESLKTESFEYVAATKDGMCWDAPLPCVQSELKGIKLKDKDSGIPGGFIKTDIQ